MTVQFCIIDYGMGNLHSIENAFRFLGCEAVRSHNPDFLERAEAFILPGVGAFGEAMSALRERGIVDVLSRRVLAERAPLLGICLGAQLIAQESSENGRHSGLGWIEGVVELIPTPSGLPLPHVGWNEVVGRRDCCLFDNIAASANFFFDHSYRIRCDDAVVKGVAEYGEPVAAALQSHNILATQFHPEKSQTNGLRLLRNFVNFAARQAQQERRIACSSGV